VMELHETNNETEKPAYKVSATFFSCVINILDRTSTNIRIKRSEKQRNVYLLNPNIIRMHRFDADAAACIVLKVLLQSQRWYRHFRQLTITAAASASASAAADAAAASRHAADTAADIRVVSRVDEKVNDRSHERRATKGETAEVGGAQGDIFTEGIARMDELNNN
jgi:hypothetical protein